VAGEPSVFAHQLRGDLAGNAHLVWNRTDDVLSEDSFWWSRFSPGSGWTAPEQLLRLGLNWFDEYGATLAVSPGGAAMLTWNSWNAGRLVRRFDLTKGWAALERVPSDDERPSYGPAALALDASGNATIVCELRSSGPTEIWAVQF
jgi:hypothetical protein